MGATYTRQSSYTDGDTITAAHTNDEFNQLLAAFAASTGHTHDGTAGEGGSVTTLLGNTLSFGDGTTDADIVITFNANNNDGVLSWKEDEDYFEFSDDILLATAEKLQFRDTAIYINSSTDGQLDLVADSEIQLAATTIDINGNVDISGTLTIGGAGISEAELEVLDGATVTTAELNIMDGDTSASATTVVDADRVVFNDDGTMKQVAVTDLAAYFDDEITAMPNLVTTAATTVGALNSGSITSGFGTIDTGSSTITTTGLISGGSLDIDDVLINGATIGHTDDTDLITLANGVVTVAGEISVTTLDIGGTNVTATAAELNILDGVTSTAAELSIVDGDTSATSTTVVDADRVVLNDNGTMVQVAVTDLAAYFDDEITAMPNLVTTAATTVGALNSGSITSGFGTIDTGSSTITTTGLISGGSLDIDNVLINGTTIGHTDDTDLITLADGLVTVAGEISVTTLDIGGTNVTATGAELNILDGVTSTTAELNILDGATVVVGEINALDLGSTAVGTAIASKAMILDSNKDYTGVRNFTLSGELDAGSLDVSGNADIDGTLEADAITVNGTALNTVIAGVTVANATLAATTTVTNSTANTNFPVVFHDESDALLDDTGALRYNPSTGTLLVPNLSVAGTTTTVDTVTMQAANAIIFEGATADANETTLSIVDPTDDRTINLPNQSGTLPVLAVASNTAITSTPEELNTLDGITAVVGELNALDLGSTAVGTAIASKAMILDSNKDYTGVRNFTLSGELDAGSLDVSGDADIDGTLEADAITVNGTALATVIAGTTVTNATNSAHVLVTDNESTNEENLIAFVEGATSTTGNVGLEMDGTLTYNPSSGTVTATIFKGNIDAVDGDFDGTLEADAISIGGTTITSTAAELNILDGVTTTAAEINLIDGGTARGTTAVADGDGVLINDAGTMRMTKVDTLSTYMSGKSVGGSNIVTTGALNSGSITSGFGAINNGESAITTTGTITFGSISDGTITVTAFVDEDNMASDSATLIPTQQSVKAYVDANVASGAMTSFQLEDDDGTEVTINNAKELKIIGSGVTTNFTDTSTGSNADPFDLTITVDAAQTGITSVKNASLAIGRDNDNLIKFSTDNQIIFEVAGGDNVIFKASGEIEASSLDISGDVDVDGTLETDAISIAGTAITSTAAELNILDGVTSTAAELNILDGVTSTTAELNVLDGITAVVGELNALDLGSTAVGTAIASKAMILDSNKDYTGVRNFTLSGELDAGSLDVSGNADIDGTLEADAITVNGTALNTVIAGVTVTNATNSAHVLVTDNENTNEENLITFVEGATSSTGNVGLEMDGNFAYNPSTGTVTATIFKGNIDAVDGDFDGTLEADAISIGGTTITSTAAELNALDGITAVVGELNALDLGSTAVGTAIASKAMILDSNKDYTGVRNFTLSGELDAGSLDISGNADIDGTLEADAITVNGTALAEVISDTTGAMFSSNTETGITVTYQDADNTIDVAINAAQTTITSLLAADIKIGEDDQTKIDFETADEIHFYAANVEQVYLGDNIFGPQSDSDVDLGSNSVRWKDAYVDSATVTGDVAVGDDITVAGRASGHVTADNDGSFDLAVGNDFKCTPTGNFTLTFTNPTAGQSGNVMLVNSGGHTVSAHASVAINATILTALTTAGTYHLAYYCSADSGNDTILVSASAALS